MSGPPQVSAIIPTRNRLGSLRRTLAAVLDQRGVDVEVVVVDEASSDGTWQYLRSLADPRVRAVRHQRALGVATARNTGLVAARAPWVAFTDDDDLWAPTKLARQLDQLEAGRAGWSCTGSVVVDASLHIHRLHAPPPPNDLVGQLLRYNAIPGGASGVVARRDLVLGIGGFDPSLSNLADWDLWIRLAMAAPMTSVDDPLMAYVVHRDAASHDVARSIEEYGRLIEKHDGERRNRGTVLEPWVWERYLAECHLRAGRRYPAAAVQAREAVRSRRLRPLGWAAVALLAPTALHNRRRRLMRRVVDPRLVAAELWLAGLSVPKPSAVASPRPPPRASATRAPSERGADARRGAPRAGRKGAYVVVAEHLDPPTLAVAGELDAVTTDEVAPLVFDALCRRPGPWVFDLQYLYAVDEAAVAMFARAGELIAPALLTLIDPPNALQPTIGSGRAMAVAPASPLVDETPPAELAADRPGRRHPEGVRQASAAAGP